MRLLFLSTTRDNRNAEIIALVRGWIGESGRVGYIPSCPDPERRYFGEVEDWLNGVAPGVDVSYLDIHDGRRWQGQEVAGFDCFFISGGHTYRLMSRLRKSGMADILAEMASEMDTPIIGVSAGGIVLTPDITSASAPNDIGLTDCRGLALVSWSFFPHYEKDDRRTASVREYLAASRVGMAYALPEHSGLLVEDGDVRTQGYACLVE